MASLQFVIDNICANFTEKAMYTLIHARLEQGPFRVDELLPQIQARDRSLDPASARLLADAALEDLSEKGELRVEGESVYPPG